MTHEPISVGVTGHRDIAPGDPIRVVTQELRRAIWRHTGGTQHSLRGVSCLAAGADQLFAEVTLELGGALVAVVPCIGYESTLDGSNVANYRRLLASATEVVELGFSSANDAAFAAASEHLIDECDVILAVWDGAPAAGHGGTADVVEWAVQRGRVVEVIWPQAARRTGRQESGEEGDAG